MSKLVIVESPSKASTIKGYLWSNYKVIASKGHVRDLPKSKLGVDIENGFEAHYINIRGKGDLIKDIIAKGNEVIVTGPNDIDVDKLTNLRSRNNNYNMIYLIEKLYLGIHIKKYLF